MRTTEDILDSIENRLRQLHEEIDALHVARSALGRNGSASATGRAVRIAMRPAAGNTPNAAPGDEAKREQSGSPAGARRARASARAAARKSRRSSRRSLQPVPASKLEALLSGAGGLATSALAERANADRDQVLALLRELEAAGRVRRTGQRRATRWHVITDEERIQQRVAELEAASRRAA